MPLRPQVAIWALELIAQAVLLGLLLAVTAIVKSTNPDATWKDLVAVPLVALLATPMILLPIGQNPIVPSVIATVLYLLHFEFAHRTMGTFAFPWVFRVAGAFVVFGTSLFGTRMLRRDARILAARALAERAADAPLP
jgi:Na+-translocating ferredoxin:NAD+ oxidoreductase RnfD subunit